MSKAEYDRGLQKLKDKRLRSRLQAQQEKFKEAAEAAKASEYLLVENQGILETDDPMEKTYKFRQSEIEKAVDMSTRKKRFELSLKDFGPYVGLDYSRSGNHLVIGGAKGHVAAFDWKQGILSCELHLNETIRAVKWLQSDNAFFAVAQKKYTYIYDNQGVEVHKLHKHIEATKLEYLPYHYLLVSAGYTSFLKYQDVSTGQLVAEHRTKAGSTCSLAQNPWNAVIHCGHTNGTVSLWTPSMAEPVAKLLTCRGPVNAITINRDGRYMATSGADRSIRIWDLRQFKQLTYFTVPTPASSLHFSETDKLAAGWGPHVQVWKDLTAANDSNRSTVPYMNHLIPGNQVVNVRFAPFEDILGVGHSAGISSLIVPGSGEANFDSLEANPYSAASKSVRREVEVKQLLNKLQPDMISLDPDVVGTVDRRSAAERLNAKQKLLQQQQQQLQQQPSENSSVTNNVIAPTAIRKKTKTESAQRHLRLQAAVQRQEAHQKDLEKRNAERETYGAVLKRFV